MSAIGTRGSATPGRSAAPMSATIINRVVPFGTQTGYDFADVKGNAYAYPYAVTARIDGFGSVDGRAGVVFGPALAYVMGGFAYGDIEHTVEPVWSYASMATPAGRPVGISASSVEYKITNNISGFAEFRKYKLG